MRVNQVKDNVLIKQEKNEIQPRRVSKKSVEKFFNLLLAKEEVEVPTRKKRSADQSKEAMCNNMALTSVTLDYITSSSDVMTSAFSSLSVFGIPIGAVPASFSATSSVGAYSAKYVTDMAYIIKGCSDIPFDEIKEILNKKFDQVSIALDKNYGAIRKNLEAIHVNYQLIKRVEDKVDRNLIEIQTGFSRVVQQLAKSDAKIAAGFNKIHLFLIQESISKLITVIREVWVEVNALKYFSPEQLVIKLAGEFGLLHYLKNTVTAYSGMSLPALLNNIISQQLAIPENIDDKTKFTALYLLCLGMETYISVLFFLMEGYNALAKDSYKKNNLEAYNYYISLSLITLKDFLHFLNGVDDNEEGLLNQVIYVLEVVKNLDFIKSQRNEVVNSFLKKIDFFNEMKYKLKKISNLSGSKPREYIRYKSNHTHSSIKTPFIQWQDNRKVSYAIQYKSGKSYSQVGDWSSPYTIFNKTSLILDIGTAPQGVIRFIFRRFDDTTPELAGVVEDSNQIEFIDIDRDLYNSALEANVEIANQNLHNLIKNGAKVTAFFERGRQAIHAAIQSGNLSGAEILLENGADINAKDEEGYTPLHFAAKLGYENLIQELKNKGANVNLKTMTNWTALHFAVREGHIKTVGSLLAVSDIDTNVQAEGGFTPLHMAVSSNKNDVITAMLSSDPRTDINALSTENLSPLHLAVLSGYKPALEILLNNNRTDVNLASQGNLTALHWAAITANKNIDIVKQLLNHKNINVNACSSQGWTPLHLAILFQDKEVISELVGANNININAEGQNKLTPVHLAVETGNLDVVIFLKSKGANIYINNNEGVSPVNTAALMGYLNILIFLSKVDTDITEDTLGYLVSNNQLEIIKYFIDENKVDFTRTNIEGKTLLHLAVENGHLEMMRCILDTGRLDINISDSEGKTPLHLAVQKNYLTIMKSLIEKGARVNTKDKQNKTPLYSAVENGYLEIVEELLDQGVKVKINDSLDESLLRGAAETGHVAIFEKLLEKWKEIYPNKYLSNYSLHWAAKNSYVKLVEGLVNKGEDINKSDDSGKTPLHWAAEGGM